MQYLRYKIVCSGCRARAYGLSNDFIDHCGDLHVPTERVKIIYLKIPGAFMTKKINKKRLKSKITKIKIAFLF